MDGVLLIDKPRGPTSFDVVRAVRRKTRVRRVGHAGTLDPLASGLLVVCVGQGTKLVPFLMDGVKRYEVTVALGVETDTLDSEGSPVCRASVPALNDARVRKAAEGFVGPIAQVPPRYSALKQDGEPLYKKARRGESVDPAPREVTIHRLDLLSVERETLSLVVECGKGTYIRSLARDLALALGTVGHVITLRRTASSGFDVARALAFSTVEDAESNIAECLLPLSEALPSMARYALSDAEAVAVGHGKIIRPDSDPLLVGAPPGERVALIRRDGTLAAIGVLDGQSVLRPLRGFPDDGGPASQ